MPPVAKPRRKLNRVFLLMLAAVALIVMIALRWAFSTRNIMIQLEADDIQKITIVDNQVGLGFASLSSYVLSSHNCDLVGKAMFSSGQLPTVTNVFVPAEAVRKFITVLATATLIEGKYVPLFEHTDDYPSIVIHIETAAGSIEVFTQSQGALHVPWGAH